MLSYERLRRRCAHPPANSVLGGSATSSAPAFPSSCAAATAAAAAVRGRGDVDGIASIGVETHHLQ